MDLISLVTGIFIGGGSLFFIMHSKYSAIHHITNELKEKNSRQESEIKELIQENASLGTRNDSLKEQQMQFQKEMDEKKRQMENEFRLMANSILEEKSRRFTELNSSELRTILDPLRENIIQFRSKVEETYDKESKQRFSLEEKIRELVQLNAQISEDARNLTKALKGDSKIQGDWGEMILETILERSGLQKNREYFVQETMTDEHGKPIIGAHGQKMRPDVMIAYPDNRRIIVDSKVSLTAFVRFTEAETKAEADKAMNEHLLSIKSHIHELATKNYQDYARSLDFVMMFIPNEPAYMVALQANPDLWQYAYEKRVLLISPTNLITALKLIADLWKRDNQSRNAIEIAERGGRLYDKFVTLYTTFKEVGSNIEKVNKSYQEAMGQLHDGNGNLLSQVDKLRELGVKAKKQLAVPGQSETDRIEG
ncbi:MAG: DNA recombination protein RmuC [Bacteroidales bacterium]